MGSFCGGKGTTSQLCPLAPDSALFEYHSIRCHVLRASIFAGCDGLKLQGAACCCTERSWAADLELAFVLLALHQHASHAQQPVLIAGKQQLAVRCKKPHAQDKMPTPANRVLLQEVLPGS